MLNLRRGIQGLMIVSAALAAVGGEAMATYVMTQ
jgi:hypothetical protein